LASFNSFYIETEPPFIKAMSGFLHECGLRGRRPTVVQWMMRSATVQFEADKKTLLDVAHESM
jgi:hypothetical protein